MKSVTDILKCEKIKIDRFNQEKSQSELFKSVTSIDKESDFHLKNHLQIRNWLSQRKKEPEIKMSGLDLKSRSLLRKVALDLDL